MKIILSIFLLSASHFALAEYNGWFLKLAIETTKGEVIIGHVYRASAYFNEDSLSNERYVTRSMSHYFLQGDEPRMVYYENLVKYDYVPEGGTETYSVYTLIGEKSILVSDIKNIKILNHIDFSYLVNVASAHALRDTIWMKTPPVAKYIVDGYLCSWQLFVHEESANTKQVLAELKAFNNKNQQQLKKLEEELDYANGDYYREIEAKIETLEEGLDEAASDILAKLNGERVVIISFCSC